MMMTSAVLLQQQQCSCDDLHNTPTTSPPPAAEVEPPPLLFCCCSSPPSWLSYFSSLRRGCEKLRRSSGSRGLQLPGLADVRSLEQINITLDRPAARSRAAMHIKD